MTIFKTKDAKNAFGIGATCFLAYVACYFARNLLGVASPYMIEESFYDITYIGLLSTVNMFCYAVGQLVNGIIGDKICAKLMVSGGLFLSGICYGVMVFSQDKIIVTLMYSLSGFFLSMLFAPMTKTIAENTRPVYTIRCSLGLTFASLVGPPIAGMFAIIFHWKIVFIICAFALMSVGVFCFLCFSVFEKKSIVQYRQRKKMSEKGGSIKVLIKHSIITFSFVAILTGIVRTSVVFWIPTYLSQYLELSTTSATSIFTVMSVAQASAPYINMVLVYDKLLKKNISRTLSVMFTVSTFSFLMMYILHIDILNILFLFLAVLSANGASAVLWNAYCPSLKDTGMVSSATGYLDFLSYAAAALANQLFANAVSQIGWGNLILIWSGLMLVGIIVVVIPKLIQSRPSIRIRKLI